jgi:hypothetical protein
MSIIYNKLMKENRIGTFSINSQLLRWVDHRTLTAAFGHFIIARAEFMFLEQKIWYEALSELFEPVEEGQRLPHYLITIIEEVDGSVRVEAQKGEDWQQENYGFKSPKGFLTRRGFVATKEEVVETVAHSNLASTLLGLDGKQECDLAAEMARRDPKATDALCVTLGQAVAAVIDPRYTGDMSE